MKRTIKKVAVLGSGVMGSRIACHFANIGVKVLLLDIAPKTLSDAEKNKGLALDDKVVKDRLVNEALQNAVKSNPSPLYDKAFVSRITTGNFDDDMKAIADCDWIIEVVVENLRIKQSVFEQVERYRTPGTLITTNTSGIPIHMMLEGRSEDFRKHFCGTHFFNPPRYLRLLEIIPSPDTQQQVTDFLMHYGDLYLGKKTVLCKDTPAFIANRVGIFAIMKIIGTMQKLGLNIDEVDKLTGPVIGRPKSATFRTSDVVGLDTLIKVADNLYDSLQEDKAREVFKLPDLVRKMEENKWLGDKTGQGFYKKTKDEKGKTVILTLDLETLEYKPKQKVKMSALEAAKPMDDDGEKFKMLFGDKGKAGQFYRDSFYALFQYVSFRLPEIADHLYQIDDALRAGFGWKYGPFETWDMVGLRKTLVNMEEAGYTPQQWVYAMLDNNAETFYITEKGVRKFYDIQSGSYQQLPGTEAFILLDTLREDRVLFKNAGVSLFDLGDGILNLEFHSKSNTMGGEVIEGINRALDMAEKEYRGLVIANEGENFTVGANIGIIFMTAVEQEFDELDMMIRQFQKTMMRARYSSVPVIVAPHSRTLGGGCELSMHGDRVVAAAETYMGLVEVGVGLIPSGGGTKEMALRTAERYTSGDIELNAIQESFMNIAMAKVATSAYEAMNLNYLRNDDKVVINSDRRIAAAKATALEMAEAGYSQPVPKTDIKVQGRTGIALFQAGIHGMLQGRYISEHDAKIAGKLAHVICGGELSYPQGVPEQYLLDLEREAFLSLCGEKKTLERIQSILQTGKPLRN